MAGHHMRQPAGAVDVVVIGAGHAGLAMSHILSLGAIEHIVLERGGIANSWRTERWNSLRLLTPNWMTRLPGRAYSGSDPDGYMSAGAVADFIADYAAHTSAPVLTGTTVTRVALEGGYYRVATECGDWRCRAVVLATGAFNTPVVPLVAGAIPVGVQQLTARNYREPGQLAQGGVLVVGGSSTGLQLAQEIQRSGRPVTLATGEHVRMPRVYRGRDIQWWMFASGILDQRIEDTDDPERARRVPSPQLVGTPDFSVLDFNVLQEEGVEIAGRLMGVRDGKAQFSGSLRNVCALADLKMNRLLASIDDWAELNDLSGEIGPAERFAPTNVGRSPRLGFELRKHVSSVIWATGFRPDYSWLDVPVFDRWGELKHDRGVVDAPGLYVLGLPYLRRRKSSFIHGAEDDVRELGAHVTSYLGGKKTPIQKTTSAITG